MEKQQILSFIQSQLATGSITQADLQALAPGSFPAAPQEAVITQPAATVGHEQRNLINVFYAIGAIIVLTGVVILVAQHWTDIGFVGRLLITAGIAATTYLAGLLLRAPSQRVLSQVFLTLAAALAPLGAHVILVENGLSFGFTEQMIIAIGFAFLFGIAWLVTHRSITTILTIFYGTWAYYAGLLRFLEGVTYPSNLLTWATLVAGVAYILLGFAYKGVVDDTETSRESQSVKTLLYALGTLGVLGAGFALNGVWDLVYIPLVFGMFYLSVYLKTRAMLVFAALFLIAHLVYLTSKYFVDSVGWPIALVMCGFIIIGIGYMTYYVMNRFIKKQS